MLPIWVHWFVLVVAVFLVLVSFLDIMPPPKDPNLSQTVRRATEIREKEIALAGGWEKFSEKRFFRVLFGTFVIGVTTFRLMLNYELDFLIPVTILGVVATVLGSWYVIMSKNPHNAG